MSQKSVNANIAINTKELDWLTFAIYLSLIAIGWLMIFTVGYGDGYPSDLGEFLKTPVGKQSIALLLASLLLIAITVIDVNFWRTFGYLIYGITLFLLLLVLFFGAKINGNRSWFNLGGFGLQPSEFAKFGTALAMSNYLSSFSVDLKERRSQLTSMGIIAFPILLVLLQPDAGSAIVFTSFYLALYREGFSPVPFIVGLVAALLFIFSYTLESTMVVWHLISIAALIAILYIKNGRNIWLATLGVIYLGSWFAWKNDQILYLFIANIGVLLAAIIKQFNRGRYELAAILIGSILAATIFCFGTTYLFKNVLQPHQQERIKVWLKPQECDPRGSLYNVLQSKMAIGSGGLEGKGFLQGTMTKLNYVPEQNTDFIFCTVGEEQGFIGALGVIGLFLFFLYKIVMIAERQRSNFSRIYAYCIAGIIFIHFFVNLGMTMGLVPIIGIPLPFISYGGSSLLSFTLMIGVLLKLDSHRYSL